MSGELCDALVGGEPMSSEAWAGPGVLTHCRQNVLTRAVSSLLDVLSKPAKSCTSQHMPGFCLCSLLTEASVHGFPEIEFPYKPGNLSKDVGRERKSKKSQQNSRMRAMV